MKRERGMIVLGLLINTMIVLIKIYGGKVFNSYLLMVSGYFTLCDMAIVFMAYCGSVARGRRASKKEPFGFGNIECFSQIVFGFLLCFLAIYIFVKSFFLIYTRTDLQLIFVVIFLALFKFLSSSFLFDYGKKLQSEMLISTSHGSYYDACLTLVSLIFILLSCFYSMIDFIGSILMSLPILVIGIKIIFDNVILLNGENDNKKKNLLLIKNVVNETKVLSYSNASLVSVGDFYKVMIDALVDKDAILKEVIKGEVKARRKIKKTKEIKSIEFDIHVK